MRYLQKMADGRVFPHDDELAKKKGMVEIPEEEALWILGGKKGAPPKKITVSKNISGDVISLLGEMTDKQVAEIHSAIHLMTKNEETEALPPVGEVVNPGLSGKTDSTETAEPPTEGGEKPISKMNKDDLMVYAFEKLGEVLNASEMTKEEMKNEIIRLEEEQKAA